MWDMATAFPPSEKRRTCQMFSHPSPKSGPESYRCSLTIPLQQQFLNIWMIAAIRLCICLGFSILCPTSDVRDQFFAVAVWSGDNKSTPFCLEMLHFPTAEVDVEIATPEIIVSVYLLLFVPLAMAWAYFVHYGCKDRFFFDELLQRTLLLVQKWSQTRCKMHDKYAQDQDDQRWLVEAWEAKSKVADSLRFCQNLRQWKGCPFVYTDVCYTPRLAGSGRGIFYYSLHSLHSLLLFDGRKTRIEWDRKKTCLKKNVKKLYYGMCDVLDGVSELYKTMYR